MSGGRWDDLELMDETPDCDSGSDSGSSSGTTFSSEHANDSSDTDVDDSEDIEELDPSEAIDSRPTTTTTTTTITTAHTSTERLPVPEVTDRWEVRTDSGERSLPDSVARDPDSEVTREGTRRVYSALCAMAHVEHRPTAAQRQELLDYQDYLGVSPWVAKLIEAQARRSPELRVGRRVSELELVMNAMIDMACADGGVSMAEGRLLARVNERAGWSREQVGAAIKRSLARQAAAAAASEVAPIEVATTRVEDGASEGLFEASDVKPVQASAEPDSDVIEIQAIQTSRAIRVVEPIEVQTTHEPDERGQGLLPISDEQPIAQTFQASVWDEPESQSAAKDDDQRAREELDKLDELLSGLSRRTVARGVTPDADASDEAEVDEASVDEEDAEEVEEKPIRRSKRSFAKKTPPKKKAPKAPKSKKPINKLVSKKSAPKVLALADEEPLEELDEAEAQPSFRPAASLDAPIGLQSQSREASNPFEDSGDDELILLSPANLPLRKRA